MSTARSDKLASQPPEAVAKLRALADGSEISKIWKILSPGKKAAASGSDAAAPPIDEAMRAAVAAAAKRAVTNANANVAGPNASPALLVAAAAQRAVAKAAAALEGQ